MNTPSRTIAPIDRVGGRLAEAADAGVAHRLADLAEQRQVAFRRRVGEALDRLLLTHGADSARHALAARLVAEEGCDLLQLVDHVDVLIVDHHHAGPEREPGVPRRLVVEHEVEVARPGEAARRAAEQHRLQLGAGAHAAGELDQLPEGDAELDLVHARTGDRARTGRTGAGWRRARRARSPGTLASVSTLLTAVGLPNRPTSNGNGGLLRGSPRWPSIELKIAVSSPQM